MEENSIQKAKEKMKYRRIGITLVAIGILLIVGVSGWMAYSQYKHFLVHEKTSVDHTKFANIDFESTVEWNDEYRLHVMYPVTDKSQIDKTVRAEVDTYVYKFRKLVAAKPKGGTPYELNLKGAVNYASKTAINFEYTGKWHLKDGKKSSLTINLLFDRQTGKEIRTADLFRDNSYLQIASTTSRQELPGILKQHYNKSLVERGTAPTAKHFDHFEIADDHKVNIIFEPGQVADASAGTIKVPINLDSLSGDLRWSLVGKIFPDYLAQVQAAQKQAQEQAAKSAAEAMQANGDVDCSKAKCVALTFDDGPGSGTATILDTLKQHNARATFMVVGSRVAANADLLKREVAEGHDVGNHTWDHADLLNLTSNEVAAEINQTQQAVANVVGKQPFMVRPPYGDYNKTVLNEVGLPFILWSVDPDDWRDRNADIVYQRVMSAVQPGAIVLSHDLYPTTAAAYQRIIPDLIKQGYALVTVSDLLDIDPKNPPVRAFSSR